MKMQWIITTFVLLVGTALLILPVPVGVWPAAAQLQPTASVAVAPVSNRAWGMAGPQIVSTVFSESDSRPDADAGSELGDGGCISCSSDDALFSGDSTLSLPTTGVSPRVEGTVLAGHVSMTTSLASGWVDSPINAEGIGALAAEVITIDDGCPYGDPSEFERRAPPAEDAWICISVQNPVYWAYGHNDALYVRTNASPVEWVRWHPTIGIAGRYKVEVSIPSYHSNVSKTQKARYKGHHADGDTWQTIDQAAKAGTWQPLGTYRFNAGTSGYVYLESYTTENPWRLLAADAARFTLQPPDKPTLQCPSNSDGDGNYTLDWSNAVGATSYTLQERHNGGSWNTVYSGSKFQASRTGRSPGTWDYRVRASNPSGNSNWSNVCSVSVKPDVPTLSAIVNPDGDGNYAVDWSDADGASSYTLQEDVSSSFTNPTTLYSGSVASYDVIDQDAGTWYYRVRASNAGGDSSWSNVEFTTVGLPPDDYEPDDTCTRASSLPADGFVQYHTFHDAGDADWVRFTATAGDTYVLQTTNTGPDADTVMELYNACGGDLEDSDDNAFGPGVRIVWTCPNSGTYYLKVFNHDSDAYGDLAYYDLSIRAQSHSGVAIIVTGRRKIPENLQANFDYVTRQAYRTFRSGGLSHDDIYLLHPDTSFDADEDGTPDTDDTATSTHLEYAITIWAAGQVGPGVPLYLYLVDHGLNDVFYVNTLADVVSPSELDAWLTTLETLTGCDQVNVITEACFSGSFIVPPEEISKSGRVIITASGANQNAYGYKDGQGAYFSNTFLSQLKDNADLWTSYETTRDALWDIRGQVNYQQPWLDDNGDGVFDAADGAVARQRGLMATFGGAIPWVASVEVGPVSNATAVVSATVYDDGPVKDVLVWAEVYAPSFEPPAGDEVRLIDVPRILLLDGDRDHVYTGSYGGFTETGEYRLVVYARDGGDDQAMPQSASVRTGWKVFLPLVLKETQNP